MAVNSNLRKRLDTAGGEVVALVVTPLVALASVAVWAFSDMVLAVGPSGRLMIAIAALGVTALVAMPWSGRPAVAIAAGAALVAGAIVVLSLTLGMNQVGCQPAGTLDVGFHLAPVGAATALAAFAGPAAAIVVGPRGGVVVAALSAAGVGAVGLALALLTLVSSFPGLGCAYVPA